MSAAEVREVVAADRTVAAVLPWATLSAARMRVEDRGASGHFTTCARCRVWATRPVRQPGGNPNATVWTNVEDTAPGQTFVIVLVGYASGPGTLKYETGSGSGELTLATGDFRFPIAVVGSGGSFPFLTVKPKSPPSYVYVDAVQVFRVD